MFLPPDTIQTSPDAVQPAITMHQTYADMHQTGGQLLNNGATTMAIVWSGNDHDAYQVVQGGMDQHNQANVNQLKAAAQIFLNIMHWLEIISTIFILARLLWALVAAALALSVVTLGTSDVAAGELTVEAGATQASGIGFSTALKLVIKAAFQAFIAELKARMLGALVGGGVGAAVGVEAWIQHGRNPWDGFVHVLFDTASGAGMGIEMSGPTPWAYGGMAAGFTQAAADTYVNGFDLETAFNDVTIDTTLATGIGQTFDLPQPEPPVDGPAPLTTPQGLTDQQFSDLASTVRNGTGDISSDIVVQGSRAAGTASATSDIDLAVRVDQQQFDDLIQQRFGDPNPGSAKWRTMQHAIDTGKIQAGEAGLRALRKTLEAQLGMDVDISIILKGGPFDQGPSIPLP